MIKIVDVPCVCGFVSKQIEGAIDMRKVVNMARSCGKKVALGTRCGIKLSIFSWN
ncbi:hypothetical protein RGQ29_001261 [Quercus rubra]|uniref:Bifunctional inhibitor/plant lipid transfer protein/seed storage helical domain-containing protein n=1 Tax=Quercus rubra TaxID=3512 RepID=A0AAN7GGN0_QUERU|nr:hypothetical protein RGQ29_001261 [Quercus rubra]